MSVLADGIAQARGLAVRHLLAQPLIDQASDPETFSLVATHRGWLVPWFEETCGWQLVVDVRDGMARLLKRRPDPDPTRPVIRPRRTRAARRPFDRRRYELLCLVLADLSRRPATTISLLAEELVSVTTSDGVLRGFAPHERVGERRALVDVLGLLAVWGVVTTSGGNVTDYVDDADSNAIIEVDQTRLHHLLATPTAPSTLAPAVADGGQPPPAEFWRLLAAEPRYGAADAPAADDEARNRARRHALARRLLDDPWLPFDELDDGEATYLSSGAGRSWLRERLAAAGFVLEERAEGWAAVDPDAVATDRVFPAPGDNVKQAALLLVDDLVEDDGDGNRRFVPRTVAELQHTMLGLLATHGGWAKSAREDDGHITLVADALALLAEVGLVRVDDSDGDEPTVVPQPLLARYRTMPARVANPTLPL